MDISEMQRPKNRFPFDISTENSLPAPLSRTVGSDTVKMEETGLSKVKEFYSAEDNTQRMRRQAPDWEKIFEKDTSDKRLLPKIYKEFLKFNNKKTTHLKMGQRP